jgi:hypothetical protein
MSITAVPSDYSRELESLFGVGYLRELPWEPIGFGGYQVASVAVKRLLDHV